MIKPSKYNGINFSPDFTRSGGNYDYNSQRVKNYIPNDAEIKYISFELASEYTTVEFRSHTNQGSLLIASTADDELELTASWIYFFAIPSDTLDSNFDVYFSLNIDGNEIVYSEIYRTALLTDMQKDGYCQIIASNSDNRHGYLTNQTFGFFKSTKFKTDFPLNKTTEYNYSYSRKKILASENQKGKRFTFFDLTMYNANLLQWLCRCENLSIDGVQYQLISDFTEINNDPNSEIMSLQADFVEANQSFFEAASTDVPLNIFTNSFFN